MAFISLVLPAVSVSVASSDLPEKKTASKRTSICSHQQKLLKLKKDEQLQEVVFKMRKTFIDIANGENKQSEKELLKLLNKQLAPYKIEYNKNPQEFVRQAFYLRVNTPKNRIDRADKTEGWAEIIFWDNLIVGDSYLIPFTPSPDVQIEVISPYLCSTDKEIENIAYEWVHSLIHSRKLKPRGFSPFKAYLKKQKNDLPLRLIDVLYSISPKESLLIMSELHQKNSDTKKLLETINLKDKKKSLSMLSERSEWWVQLYILSTIRENKSLRSPEIIEQLEKTKHALISKESIDFLKVKSKKTLQVN